MDMVVSPHALVESHSRLRLHSIYYITKQVCKPPCIRMNSCMFLSLHMCVSHQCVAVEHQI